MSAVERAAAVKQRPEAVVVQDLHKYFGPLEVLKGVSMAACEGDVVSMIGASGSGKSTFLRCINFLEMPTQGRIVVAGEEVRLKKTRDGHAHLAGKLQVRTSTARTLAVSTVSWLPWRLNL